MLPEASRVSMPFLMVAWTAILMAVHQDWNIADWAVLLLGAYVGLRFYFIREAGADQSSYTLYNVCQPFLLANVSSKLTILT